MQRLSVIMIPNCTGAIPSVFTTTGYRIGVVIRMSDAMSMMQPSPSSNRRTTGLSEIVSNAFVAIAGIFR
jgi:hypothetical protein